MRIALERRKASALALLRVCRPRAVITVPATVVAEWWRGTHAVLLDAAVLALARAAG